MRRCGSRLARLGLVSRRGGARCRRRSGSRWRQVLEEIGPRLRGLRSDPAVQELLADPAVVAMLENGDTLGLLAHPKFRELVSRISSPPRRDAARERALEEREIRVGRVGRDLAGQADQLEARRLVAGLRRGELGAGDRIRVGVRRSHGESG